MTTAAFPLDSRSSISPLHRLWRRQLHSYPANARRYLYLCIVVVATIVQYYELYVQGAVAPAILRQYDMSFMFYVYTTGVASVVGALASLVAGLADRWGRANLVAYGLGFTGAIILFGLPNAPNKMTFGVLVALLSLVEGMILVATPALVRDFSPQVGRAAAMGFWTLGPVLGSLVVSAVASNTLRHLHAWQDQFYICGVAGLVVFVVALVGLRELSPPLRDQLMMSLRDRALVEARARGLDVEAARRNPWRQVLKPDVIGSAFAIAVFLLIYYTAVGFFVVYFETTFSLTDQDANGVGNWMWGFEAILLVGIGFASDRLRVRKPFMLVGALGTIAMTLVLLNQTGQAHTGYYHLAFILMGLGAFLGVTYAPWMASFTETVERRNPALTATGLAVWGLILRLIVAALAFTAPLVVNALDPLVDNGPRAQAIQAQYGPQLATIQLIDPDTAAALAKNPNDLTAGLKAANEVAAGAHLTQAEAIQRLLDAKKVPAADLAFLQEHGQQVVDAQRKAPDQWRTWFWICLGGQVVFIPLIFTMAGEWNPRKAREREQAHERAVAAETARLGLTAD
ncbi:MULTISPECIES: MFS transporter [Pseudofrankia]|uniref:MFS transporter n=1 Tax=Pseudofrankia TaxID=2994363 RepID=UPI000234D4AA|nr:MULTISPECIES: MFS transporter [Pseudofrankia]OHV34627.1 MFS transporter [Pseudofrankia sp. EUN1h]